jgi:hypothetical protein
VTGTDWKAEDFGEKVLWGFHPLTLLARILPRGLVGTFVPSFPPEDELIMNSNATIIY